MLNELLIEKYRPHNFEEFISYEDNGFITDIEKYCNENPFGLPNMVLYGHAGTGKTTLARIIVDTLDTDILYLNASDERGIGVMRGKVKDFVVTLGKNPNAPKIVHFDEADKLTKDAQNMLRNLIEERSKQCRFIFTCNNFNDIIDPIKSRCVCYNMKSPDEISIMNRLKYICAEENIIINTHDLTMIVENNYPDIRRMIKSLMFDTDDYDTTNTINEIYDGIKSGKINNKLIYDRTLNHRVLLKDLFNKMYNEMTMKQLEIFAEVDYRMTVGSTPEIQFVYLIKELMK